MTELDKLGDGGGGADPEGPSADRMGVGESEGGVL